MLDSRAPYGARGLKLLKIKDARSTARSRPVWGAWIEIPTPIELEIVCGVSRPVWGAWIEITTLATAQALYESRAPYGARGLKYSPYSRPQGRAWSRPVWGAWIEITLEELDENCNIVAPRMGRVD